MDYVATKLIFNRCYEPEQLSFCFVMTILWKWYNQLSYLCILPGLTRQRSIIHFAFVMNVQGSENPHTYLPGPTPIVRSKGEVHEVYKIRRADIYYSNYKCWVLPKTSLAIVIASAALRPQTTRSIVSTFLRYMRNQLEVMKWHIFTAVSRETPHIQTATYNATASRQPHLYSMNRTKCLGSTIL